MIFFCRKLFDDFTGGVIGVGDGIEGFSDLQRFSESRHFIQQGSLVPIRKDHPFMYSADKRDGEDGIQYTARQDSDCLKGMAHDKRWLRVRFGFLVNAFNRGHFFAFFRYFDPVANEKKTAVHPQYLGKNLKDRPRPNKCELLKFQTASMEKIQDAIVAERLKTESSHDAGDTRKIASHRYAGDTGYEPQESLPSGT